MKTLFTLILLVASLLINIAHATDEEINKSLDAFHRAAAVADFDTYIGLLSQDAIFLGTDGSERWTKTEFSTFVKPYFEKGQGWLYVPTERNISYIASTQVVYFDEILTNESYGETRGSGVMVKTEEGWKIAQYNLSIPMPNAMAKALVEQIKRYKDAQRTLKESGH